MEPMGPGALVSASGQLCRYSRHASVRAALAATALARRHQAHSGFSRGGILRPITHFCMRPRVNPQATSLKIQKRVRGLPARPYRHPPRDRPPRPHPHRRPDLRHHPLRQQRAPMVRVAAIAPKPIGSFVHRDRHGHERAAGPHGVHGRVDVQQPAPRSDGVGDPRRHRHRVVVGHGHVVDLDLGGRELGRRAHGGRLRLRP